MKIERKIRNFAAGMQITLVGFLFLPSYPAGADPRRDIQLTGLPALYQALFAVANCPNVALDQQRFERTARLYRLRPEELGVDGPFALDIGKLDVAYRVRIGDDGDAFCSVNRLQFAVPHGVLIDRGPIVPNPFPGGPVGF